MIMIDDTWLSVFELLPTVDRIRFERVSKQWNRLLRNSWKRLRSVDTNELCNGIDPAKWNDCLRAVLDRCAQRVTSFRFRQVLVQSHEHGEESLLPEVVVSLIKKAPALTSFRVENCFLRLKTLEMVLKLPSTLKVFRIEHCIIHSPSIIRDFFSHFRRFSTLEEFTITGCGSDYPHLNIDDNFMQHIPSTVSILCLSIDGEVIEVTNAAFASRLTKLRLFDVKLSLLSNDGLNELILHAPNLRYLDLSRSMFLDNFSSIGKLTQLRCLILNGYTMLRSVQLHEIISGCKSLEVLSLEHCYRLSSEELKEIGKCSTLKELRVSGVTTMTDDILISIVYGTIFLRVLDISYCKFLTKSSLQSLTVLQNLDHLCVNGISVVDASFVNLIREFRPQCQIEAAQTGYTMSGEQQALLQEIRNRTRHVATVNPYLGVALAAYLEPDTVQCSYQISRYQYL